VGMDVDDGGRRRWHLTSRGCISRDLARDIQFPGRRVNIKRE
jgi:hypothetical protein